MIYRLSFGLSLRINTIGEFAIKATGGCRKRNPPALLAVINLRSRTECWGIRDSFKIKIELPYDIESHIFMQMEKKLQFERYAPAFTAALRIARH